MYNGVFYNSYLIKDEKNNKVRLVQESDGEKTAYIKTRYYPVKQFGDKTLVEAELITGKPHQIRIHLSGAGHPLLGDYKYGHKSWNDSYKQQFRISSQMLYACRLEFPEMEAPFEKLSGKILESPVPKEFQLLMKGKHLRQWGDRFSYKDSDRLHLAVGCA